MKSKDPFEHIKDPRIKELLKRLREQQTQKSQQTSLKSQKSKS